VRAVLLLFGHAEPRLVSGWQGDERIVRLGEEGGPAVGQDEQHPDQ